MEYYSSGIWAMTFCFGLFFFYTYFKGKYPPIALWIGIGCTAITIWALFESWTYGVLKEDIEYGIYLIIICFVIGFAGKISFDRSKKKREALWKKNEEEAQEVKERNTPTRRDRINTANDKISAHLLEYRDFIIFNEYTIGKEIYGASMNEEFHTYIKIQKTDIGKFNYDLIIKFLNESTKHENYLSPSISLQGLCREYSIKFEEKYEKLKEFTDKDTYEDGIETDEKILKEQLDTGEFEIKGKDSLTPVSPIRDWNQMCLSLAEKSDKSLCIIFYNPKEKVWKESKQIDLARYYKSLIWIKSE